MLAGLFIVAFFKSRKLLIAGALMIALLLLLSPRMQFRTMEMVDSAKSLFGLNEQKPIDPTARFRIESWGRAWEIIQDNPMLGIGFNRYANEMNERGWVILRDHAASGSDSSLLTLWATTGVFGFFGYLAIAFVATVMALRQIWNRQDFRSYLSTGLLGGFAGMFIHSIFVNSLLFALMMGYLWVGLALLDDSSEPRG